MRGGVLLLLALALLIVLAATGLVAVVKVRQSWFAPSFEYMYVTRVWCPEGVKPPEPYTYFKEGWLRVRITPWAGYTGPCTRQTTLERISRWECRRPDTTCKSPLSFELR